MQTEVGKSMSLMLFSSLIMQALEFAATHQICWFSDKAADLQENFVKLANAKFMNTAGIWETE